MTDHLPVSGAAARLPGSASPRSRVVIVGGGLAGLAAAVALGDAGARVTLLEGRPRLGGATHSFERDGLWIDNGQHVHLRCCTSYLGFLRRLGVEHETTMQPRLAVPVARPDRPEPIWLRRSDLPAPLHLGAGLLRYRQLSVAERLLVGPAVLALRRLDVTDPRLDGRSFGDWLAAHGQSGAAIDALWDLICTATLNAHPAEASLKLAAKVFQTGLLEDKAAGDIGYSRVPLLQLHGTAAGRVLRQLGADVRLRARAGSVRPGPGRAGWQVALDGATLGADAVVLAVPHDRVNGLLPPGTFPQQARLGELESAPILNVHVVYDRRVLDLPFLAGIRTPMQWIFDRTAISGLASRGGPEQYLAVSVSAAQQWVDRSVAELRAAFLPELARLLPRARDAGVVDFFVTREKAATFRQAPGSHAFRAGARTSLPGLYVAGAWSDTGWPATMEGAVRSGETAAAALLADLPQLRRQAEEVVA